MQLVCPCKYTIFLDRSGQYYGDTLPGSIHLDGQAGLSSLNVSLIQTILLGSEHPTGDHINNRRHPKKLFQRLKPKEQQRHLNPKRSWSTTEVVRCNLSTSPTLNRTLDHEFRLSIPCDIPASAETAAFNISYEIVTSATTTDGRIFTVHQALHISHLKTPGPQDVFRYVRTFPETRLRAELILCPQLLSCQGQGRDRHISAQLLLQDVSTAGPRHGELTMTVMEELTWRVDEIHKWNIQQTERGPATTQKRTIATGRLKGRWSRTRTRAGDSEAADMKIAIPFDTNIDSADALNDFEAGNSRLTPLLTVKHHLTISITTGSETINSETGSLVDKRGSVRVLGATVPIPLHEYAEESVVSERPRTSDAVLPQFDESGSPPSYSILLQRHI